MSWLDLSKWPWKVFGASCEKKAPFRFIFLTSSPSSRLHAVCRILGSHSYHTTQTTLQSWKPINHHDTRWFISFATLYVVETAYIRIYMSRFVLSVTFSSQGTFQSRMWLRKVSSLCPLFVHLALGHYFPIRGFYDLDYNWYHISNKNSIKLIRICIEWRCVPENSHMCNPLFAYILLPIRMDWLGGSHMTYVK